MDGTDTSSLLSNRFTQHSILDTGISETSPHIGKLKQQFFRVTQKKATFFSNGQTHTSATPNLITQHQVTAITREDRAAVSMEMTWCGSALLGMKPNPQQQEKISSKNSLTYGNCHQTSEGKYLHFLFLSTRRNTFPSSCLKNHLDYDGHSVCNSKLITTRSLYS